MLWSTLQFWMRKVLTRSQDRLWMGAGGPGLPEQADGQCSEPDQNWERSRSDEIPTEWFLDCCPFNSLNLGGEIDQETTHLNLVKLNHQGDLCHLRSVILGKPYLQMLVSIGFLSESIERGWLPP